MKSITRLTFVAIVSCSVAGVSGCSWLSGDSWKPPVAVRIQSDKEMSSLMPSWATWSPVAEAGEPQGLLLREGDFFGADAMVRYHASDGPSLTMTHTDWSMKIGDTTVALKLTKPDAATWLNTATDRQLADLRTLEIDKFDSDLLPLLTHLAAANPHVDLFFEDRATMAKVLPLFQPRAVFAPEELDEAALKAIAGQKQIETLMLPANQAGSLNVLTSLPALRSLVLNNWDVAKAGPLPNGLTSLRSLLVLNLDHAEPITDLKPLGAVAAYLNELSIITGTSDDQSMDLAGIEKMTGLRTLVLWAGKLGDVSPLAALGDLRWVSLPLKTTQEQFAAFVAAHPKLTILDLSLSESVKDLTPLTTLKDLQGLILGSAVKDMSVVPKLTTLKFVGVSKDAWDAAPDQVAAIKKALPDALVVKVSSCLGSGWILLLVPVPAIAWWIRRRRAASDRAA